MYTVNSVNADAQLPWELATVSTIMAVGRIPFIMNQATGRLKFGRGPDFRHACYKNMQIWKNNLVTKSYYMASLLYLYNFFGFIHNNVNTKELALF